MNNKSAFLLFEIMIVAILVSIVSSFLLSGYNLFLKTGKKSFEYLAMALRAEEKIWDLRMKEANTISPTDLLLEREGQFESSLYTWRIQWEDTKYPSVHYGGLRIGQKAAKRDSLTFATLIYAKQEPPPPAKE